MGREPWASRTNHFLLPGWSLGVPKASSLPPSADGRGWLRRAQVGSGASLTGCTGVNGTGYFLPPPLPSPQTELQLRWLCDGPGLSPGRVLFASLPGTPNCFIVRGKGRLPCKAHNSHPTPPTTPKRTRHSSNKVAPAYTPKGSWTSMLYSQADRHTLGFFLCLGDLPVHIWSAFPFRKLSRFPE